MTDQVNEAVAWMIGNPDGTVNPIGAIYHHRENCQQHIDGYGGKLAASIIPLYTHPARGVVSDAMVDLAMDADALEYGASIPASRVRRILEAAALQAAQPAVPSVPEAVRIDSPAKHAGGIVQAGDWVIQLMPWHSRVVDERFAAGWNECRKIVLAATPKDQPAQGVEP